MPEASDVGGDSAAPVKGCARRHGRGGAAVGHPEGHGAGQANALLRPTLPSLPPPPAPQVRCALGCGHPLPAQGGNAGGGGLRKDPHQPGWVGEGWEEGVGRGGGVEGGVAVGWLGWVGGWVEMG